jgi:hypothetical protein
MASFKNVSNAVAVRGGAIIWGLFGLWTFAICSIGISMEGFPDGYVTPYAQVTKVPLTILSWLALAQGAYFLFTGLRRKIPGVVGLCLQIVLAAALTVVPIQIVDACPRWDACSQAYQTLTGTVMDDGQGG